MFTHWELGVLSVIVEILDAALACFCGAKFYIVRKSLGDGLTLSRYVCFILLSWRHTEFKQRYMHNKRVRKYVLFLLTGLFVWTAVECVEFAAGAGFHLVSTTRNKSKFNV